MRGRGSAARVVVVAVVLLVVAAVAWVAAARPFVDGPCEGV
jgi:hypothetical protein